MAIDQRIYGVLAVAVAIIAVLVIFFILKSILTTTIKIILVIALVAVVVFAWKQWGESTYKAWANGNWQDSSVPCWVLNEENCKNRNDCKVTTQSALGQSINICEAK